MFFRKKDCADCHSKDAKIQKLEGQLENARKEIENLSRIAEKLVENPKMDEVETSPSPDFEASSAEKKRLMASEAMGLPPGAITLREEMVSLDQNPIKASKLIPESYQSMTGPITESKNVPTPIMSQSDRDRLREKRVSQKSKQFNEDIDSIFEHLPHLKFNHFVNPLQYYWLRSHPIKLENEFLLSEFPTLNIGDLGRDALRGILTDEELTVFIGGPDFSSYHQCHLAFQDFTQHLVKLISDEAERGTLHPSDRPLVDLCKRLLKNMDAETLALVLQSDTISLRGRLENIILSSFESETAHLYTKLEEKKVFLRSKFAKLSRIEYDEYGEPVESDISSAVVEMLQGIKVANGYSEPFRIFSEVEDDLAPYAIMHMRKWIREEINVTAPTEGLEYEKWVADQLNQNGWVARATQGSGDQGIDVIAVRESLTIGIQCKRYSGTVGNKAVQEIFAGVKHMELDGAVVISNAGFTKSARELASTTGTLLVNDEAIPELFDLIIASQENPTKY